MLLHTARMRGAEEVTTEVVAQIKKAEGRGWGERVKESGGTELLGEVTMKIAHSIRR